MAKVIPDRQPIGDSFRGVVLNVGQVELLANEPLPGAHVVAEGDFVVRYAVRYLGKIHLAIVPGLVVMDYGDMLTGDEAWTFLLRRSNLYPRAEVAGYRNDGVDDMVFVRQLDLAQPVQALVYRDAAATQPLARPAAVIAPESVVPSRLAEYLSVYPSLADWQAEQS